MNHVKRVIELFKEYIRSMLNFIIQGGGELSNQPLKFGKSLIVLPNLTEEVRKNF